MSAGLTGRWSSVELVSVLSCTLVSSFTVGRGRSLRGKNGKLPYIKSDFSAHNSISERQITHICTDSGTEPAGSGRLPGLSPVSASPF